MRRALAALAIVVAVAGVTAGEANAFLDVSPGAFYSPAVDWLEYEAITTGIGGGVYFDPDGPVTRGQMATFIWRMQNQPSPTGGPTFPDVPAGAFYAPAVQWLAKAGITTGVGNTGLFQPDGLVTRGQMATFLWRLAGQPASGGGGFPDVPPTAFYHDAVRWLANAGITTGVGNTGLFQPDGLVTRGQMATFLWRFSGQPSPPPGWVPPTPRPPAQIITFGDGVQRVGIDIPPGTYRTVSAFTDGCYWKRTTGFTGSISEIIENDFGDGSRIVTIQPGDVGFESSRCGTWTNLLAPVTSSPTSPFGDGMFIVGTDVAPGTWRTTGTDGCYWARRSGFSGAFGEIIDNDFGDGTRIVTIQPTDKGFESSRCGIWTKIG